MCDSARVHRLWSWHPMTPRAWSDLQWRHYSAVYSWFWSALSVRGGETSKVCGGSQPPRDWAGQLPLISPSARLFTGHTVSDNIPTSDPLKTVMWFGWTKGPECKRVHGRRKISKSKQNYIWPGKILVKKEKTRLLGWRCDAYLGWEFCNAIPKSLLKCTVMLGITFMDTFRLVCTIELTVLMVPCFCYVDVRWEPAVCPKGPSSKPGQKQSVYMMYPCWVICRRAMTSNKKLPSKLYPSGTKNEY